MVKGTIALLALAAPALAGVIQGRGGEVSLMQTRTHSD